MGQRETNASTTASPPWKPQPRLAPGPDPARHRSAEAQRGTRFAAAFGSSPGRKAWSSSPFTGWGQEEDRRLGGKPGLDDQAVKPVEVDALGKPTAPRARRKAMQIVALTEERTSLASPLPMFMATAVGSADCFGFVSSSDSALRRSRSRLGEPQRTDGSSAECHLRDAGFPLPPNFFTSPVNQKVNQHHHRGPRRRPACRCGSGSRGMR